jgi:hypothetical protein
MQFFYGHRTSDGKASAEAKAEEFTGQPSTNHQLHSAWSHQYMSSIDICVGPFGKAGVFSKAGIMLDPRVCIAFQRIAPWLWVAVCGFHAKSLDFLTRFQLCNHSTARILQGKNASAHRRNQRTPDKGTTTHTRLQTTRGFPL